MKVLILEDESPAAKRIERLLLSEIPEASVVGVIDSVKDSITFLKTQKQPDLILMDINLSDGKSLELFDLDLIKSKVIFTTAFDEYAVRAFRLNSIDYLLKPIDKDEFKEAILKLHRSDKDAAYTEIGERIKDLLEGVKYRTRFLIKLGDQLKFVQEKQVRYFISDNGTSHLVTSDGANFAMDEKLESLEEQCDPSSFFRINRKIYLSSSSIQKISTYFNGRLKLELNPDPKMEVIVSRERVSSFKTWLNA